MTLIRGPATSFIKLNIRFAFPDLLSICFSLLVWGGGEGWGGGGGGWSDWAKSQNVVSRPAASASPRNLLKMEILRPPLTYGIRKVGCGQCPVFYQVVLTLVQVRETLDNVRQVPKPWPMENAAEDPRQ